MWVGMGRTCDVVGRHVCSRAQALRQRWWAGQRRMAGKAAGWALTGHTLLLLRFVSMAVSCLDMPLPSSSPSSGCRQPPPCTMSPWCCGARAGGWQCVKQGVWGGTGQQAAGAGADKTNRTPQRYASSAFESVSVMYCCTAAAAQVGCRTITGLSQIR